MEYDNTNRGTLFVNNRKTTDKQPDYTGDIHFGTVKMKLAAWERTSKAGNTFLSLSVSEWVDKIQETPANGLVKMPTAKPVPAQKLVDDNLLDIPF